MNSTTNPAKPSPHAVDCDWCLRSLLAVGIVVIAVMGFAFVAAERDRMSSSRSFWDGYDRAEIAAIASQPTQDLKDMAAVVSRQIKSCAAASNAFYKERSAQAPNYPKAGTALFNHCYREQLSLMKVTTSPDAIEALLATVPLEP